MPKSSAQLQKCASTMALSGELGISELVPKSTQPSMPPGWISLKDAVRKQKNPHGVAREGQAWTDSDEASLRALHHEKISWPQIAGILGRSINSIKSKAKRLGLTAPQTVRPLKVLELPTDGRETDENLRASCKESQLKYLRAVVKANDGCSWGGHLSGVELTPNSTGSHR